MSVHITDIVMLDDILISPLRVGDPMRVRSLSPMESRVVLGLTAEKRDSITVEEIAARVGVTRTYAAKIAHTLSRKRWLQRIGRGRYLLNPPENGPDPVPDTNAFRVGSHLIDPYAFAYSTAATLHGLLTQNPRTFHLATPRKAERSLQEPVAFRLGHVSPPRFFGLQRVQRHGTEFWVTDLEKTMLDAVDRPDLLGGMAHAVQVLNAAKPRLDYRKLLNYVRRTGNRSLGQRIGHLLTRIRPEVPVPESFTAKLLRDAGPPWIRLGPVREFGREGDHDRLWHVIVNVPEERLLGEV